MRIQQRGLTGKRKLEESSKQVTIREKRSKYQKKHLKDQKVAASKEKWGYKSHNNNNNNNNKPEFYLKIKTKLGELLYFTEFQHTKMQ